MTLGTDELSALMSEAAIAHVSLTQRYVTPYVSLVIRQLQYIGIPPAEQSVMIPVELSTTTESALACATFQLRSQSFYLFLQRIVLSLSHKGVQDETDFEA